MKPSTPSKRFHRIPPPASAVTLPQKQKLPHRRTTIAAAESHGEQFHKTNLLCIAGCDLLVQFFQQFVRIDTMHHAGFFYSFSARSRTAQTMHADRHKQRSCLRCNIQNITDNGFFCKIFCIMFQVIRKNPSVSLRLPAPFSREPIHQKGA